VVGDGDRRIQLEMAAEIEATQLSDFEPTCDVSGAGQGWHAEEDARARQPDARCPQPHRDAARANEMGQAMQHQLEQR
jgi:hypothetical protein